MPRIDFALHPAAIAGILVACIALAVAFSRAIFAGLASLLTPDRKTRLEPAYREEGPGGEMRGRDSFHEEMEASGSDLDAEEVESTTSTSGPPTFDEDLDRDTEARMEKLRQDAHDDAEADEDDTSASTRDRQASRESVPA